ncbi:cation diffusion facilitator family transporter [Mesorhizobium soli]|jgi:cation diffusion facilitator family transporter|uniref:CDF family Co(II)/Ni(II) efflux transporter DmeF n=1 Tax=Pseudaminobacter soli (ex Li et al. 2025) TaxID=1295366 RepID=UPI002476C6B7|nr:CDF family Co(II)/Ni(II) efflux transporter DmeF [Mesorhizobium soli]MDH6231022.1 cation diffusion facilitator family transporter [Mesorhizobium soli]
MNSLPIERYTHDHVFLGEHHDRNARRTYMVIALTFAMMVGEIVAGLLFNSMALLADGFHMSTHAGALAITAAAYAYARRHARDDRFAFGTGKFGELAGYTSAIVLAVIAVMIVYESAMRLVEPVPIRFNDAIAVAVLGLGVNLVSAWLLSGGGDRDHAHHHHDHHAHHHHHAHDDHNLRSAYLHVLADAMTSVLAIFGLLAGWLYGWIWMDAVVGIIGAFVIASWSWGLLRTSGAVLLDARADDALAARVRRLLERDGDRVADLHLWRLGPGHMGLIVSVVSALPQQPESYKSRLAGLPRLSHVTVEVHAA